MNTIQAFCTHQRLTNAAQLSSAKMVTINHLNTKSLVEAGYERFSSRRCIAIYMTKGRKSVAVCTANNDFSLSAIIVNTFDNNNAVIN